MTRMRKTIEDNNKLLLEIDLPEPVNGKGWRFALPRDKGTDCWQLNFDDLDRELGFLRLLGVEGSFGHYSTVMPVIHPVQLKPVEPQRWRAELRETYLTIDLLNQITTRTEVNAGSDDRLWNLGNYYKPGTGEAEAAAERVSKAYKPSLQEASFNGKSFYVDIDTIRVDGKEPNK